MTTPILTTKFFIPHPRPNLVDRPRLLTELNNGVQHTLTLVCAPAGYGKSTILSEWISQSIKDNLFSPENKLQPDLPCICWLALDPADNDLVHFLSCLLMAFERVHPGISAEASAMLGAFPTPPPQSILTILINDLQKFASAIILVLDDYQYISTKVIQEGMVFLLEHLPANVHLVIATRSDPPIPLARLRARGQLVEIRADDLRFSYEEAAYLFNQVMGLGLTPNDMARLEDRTEGWIAGLQMAALALQGISKTNQPGISSFVQNFSGSNRYILDYLMEEVLSHQSEDIQDFLLQTSILENLSGSLCEAVIGSRSGKPEGDTRTSQSTLEYLERANLFLVSLDSDRLWYRYHHLFVSLLRSRLRQSLDAATVQELYRRASQWYTNQGLPAEAISQALAAPDLTYAADLLEKHILTFFYQSEIMQVHRWLELLPEHLILQHSLLCAVYAATTALLPPYPPESLLAAEKWMQAAEHTLPDDIQSTNLTRPFMYKIRSYWARFRGEPTEIVLQLIANASSLLPEDPSLPMDRNQLYIRSALQTNLGLTYWASGDDEAARQAFMHARTISSACEDLFNASGSINNLAKISCLRGLLGEAATLCREALEYFESQHAYLGHRVPYSGEIGIQLAEILIEQNKLDEAEQLLKENIELAQWTVSGNILLRGHLALARLAAARGDPAAAFEYLNETEQISKEGAGLAAAQRLNLWLTLSGDNPEYKDLARQWGQKFSLVEFTQGPPQMEWTISLALAHLILEEVEPLLAGKTKAPTPGLVTLLAWLERQEKAIQARGWVHWEIQLRVIECLARQILGDKPGTRAALRCALELAAPGGYIRIFVEEGEPLRKLLVEFDKAAGGLSPYIHKLLSAFPDTSVRLSVPPNISGGFVESLTAREIEVLQIMAEGLSNHEIAEKLFLAEGTVKFYVHAVLEKLGVHNRTQAVIEAKKQKII